MEKIKIGIVGYGNLGKGVEKNVKSFEDIELVAIFTRRNPNEIKSRNKVVNIEGILNWKEKVDIMVLCGGSSQDVPKQAPEIIKYFNTVDSFDTHLKIPEYLEKLDIIAKQNKKTAIIAAGWDPGLFSIGRLYFESILPKGKTNTFWGPGVSQGHSEAIRKIEGVEDGIEYTIPKEKAIIEAKTKIKEISQKEKHLRRCYVLPKIGANKEEVEKKIKEMPYYFSEYDTEVIFVEAKEMKKIKSMKHAGTVIRNGKTCSHKHRLELKLELESNPEFTANILLAYTRAAFRLYNEKNYGAKTVFDVPPYMLSNKDRLHIIEQTM